MKMSKKGILVILLAALGLYILYRGSQGFMDAARHGGSPAARERRLIAFSKKENIGLPKDCGGGIVMVGTKAGPGLRFTYVFQLVNVPIADIDPSAYASGLAAKGKQKLTEQYKTLPELADFRKWQVELCWQYLNKDGKELTTIVVAPQDL